MAKNTKSDKLNRTLKIALIMVLAMAGIWLQSKLVFILGDLKASVFKNFDITPVQEEVIPEEDLPIPPITQIEHHYIEVAPEPTPAPAPVYRSSSTKSNTPLPGSFAAGIN